MTTDSQKSSRASNRHLPSGSEISRIAAAEMQRPHAAGKDGVRYVEFGAIKKLCEHFGISPALFELDDKKPDEILDRGGVLLEELIQTILGTEPQGETSRVLDGAYDYLSEDDPAQPTDLIFVFGGKTPLRIQTAIERYQQGLAPRLLISGRGPFYGTSSDVTEARQYADTAIAAGVPESAIILEEASITLVDNIRRSLNLLEEMGASFSSITIINSPYVQRRGWCMWRKYLPDDVRLLRANCGTGPKFARNEWYKSEDGIRVVLGEFIKLRNAVSFDSV